MPATSEFWSTWGLLDWSLQAFVPVQDLSSESKSATIRAYASYSDGYMNDVTDMPGLNVSSLAPSYLRVNDPAGNITVSPCLPSLTDKYTQH